ncbi:DUF2782 domain-containing protein [Gammaproteobacteria bacterium]
MNRLINGLTLALLMAPCMAAESPPEAVPEPPQLPRPVQSGETLEPDVTIVDREGARYHEYRVNGQLQMVKVELANGLTYYLVDANGDGVFTRQNEPPRALAQWPLLRW